MTDVDLSIKKPEALQRPGVPADPPEPVQGEFAMTLQTVVDLVATPKLFFDMNPTFEPMREPVLKALQELTDSGIIGPVGKPLKRTGGCGGCARRKMYAFAMQFANRIQVAVLKLQMEPERFNKMAADMRRYLQFRHPDKCKAGMPVVMYARLNDNSIRKVLL